MRKWLALACIGVLLAITAFAWLRATNGGKEAEMSEAPLSETCREAAFEGVGYVICAVDPKNHAIGLHLKAADGRPYGSLAELAKAQPFLFAMNAGMYHHNLSPVGLYVESGIEGAPLNLDDGEGNFFMKPNGVFFVDREGRAAVTKSAAFAAARPDAWMATQSGPMLVIDGAVHPRFEPNGASRYIRNGVGVRADGVAVFAISREKVSLGSFARLFRDKLECPNALFFDGDISALHDGARYVVGGRFPAGPMVTVSGR